jgi:serine/threonine-protein kinase
MSLHDGPAIAPGTSFGRYDVVSLLGEGGMGAVYKARDARLQRDVALKVIRSDDAGDRLWRARFDAEARAIARLSHPHVVAVYDVGDENGIPYMVSELMEGGSLAGRLARGPLPLHEALGFALAIAEGLADAHRKGIVHRDLKPSNVLLTERGVAKIADFGLSKAAGPEISGEQTLVMTREGAIVGTPAYMSPEQADGRSVDFRSDQFSFGTMLIEMLTGRRPFDRPTQVRTLSAIVSEPADLGALVRVAPEPLVAVVRRCLEKQPSSRYNSTDELVDALRRAAGPQTISTTIASAGRTRWLRWVAVLALVAILAVAAARLWKRPPAAPRPTPKIDSLAVLPLKDLSPSRQEAYFADGLTEELTAELASVRSLRIASHTSAAAYRDTRKPLSAVARELGVAAIVEGSVTRERDRTRVTVHLVEGATDRQLWSQSLERSSRDVLTLQGEIARLVVEQVRGALEPQERGALARVPTRNPEAYDAYLHALYKTGAEWTSRSDADEAVRHAERAVALDPGFAEAWVALADACQIEMFAWKGGKEYDEKAFVAIQRALSLNPSLAEAYVVRGTLNYNQFHDYDLAAAIADYHRAARLNPNLAVAHQYLGSELTHAGLHDEAIRELQTAIRLEPQFYGAKMRLARAQWQSNRFAEALATYERFGIGPWEKIVVLAYLGRAGEALALANEGSFRRRPNAGGTVTEPYDVRAARALVHALRGERAEAAADIERAAREGETEPHFHHAATVLAAAEAELGNADAAVRFLEKAASTGMPNYPLFRDNPSLRKLRGHPSYEKFMSGLRARWEQIAAQIRGG